MPLSNTTQDILRSSPYWDDYDRDKRFHRVLIKPRTPVQTRELNQMQSMLQNQVEQLASSVYKEGAAVSGGQQSYANNMVVVQFERNDAVEITNFYNAETAVGAIIEGQTSGARAVVTQVSPQANSSYAAALFSVLNANTFSGGETLQFINPSSGDTIANMTAAPGTAVTNVASTFSVSTGVYYLRGHLVEVPKQTVILSTGSQVPSKRVGFTITESIITSGDDATLLDPALGSTNYAAPGADRLKISAVLTALDVNDDRIEPNSDENFIELVRIIDGVIQPQSDRLQSDFIEDTLARRTNDESGDYVVRPFRLLVKEHNPPVGVPNITGRITGNTTSTTIQAANTITTLTLANGSTSNVTTLFQSEISVGDILVVNGEQRTVDTITSNTALTVNAAFTQAFTNSNATVISGDKLNIELEKGKAYVRGYEIETKGTIKLAADRARTTQAVTNSKISTAFGPYVLVTLDKGLFNINQMELVDLHSVEFTSVDTALVNATAGNYLSSKIGTARARSFAYHTGTGDTANNTVYKLYLVDAGFETKTFLVDNTNDSNNTALTGNSTVNSFAVNVTSRSVTLRQNAAATSGSIFARGNNAFVGSTIKFYTTDGARLAYSVLGSSFTNTTSNDGVHTLTLDADDNLQFVNTTANVQVIFSDKCIRSITNNANTKLKGVTTSFLSKVGYAANGNTVMYGTDSTGLLFRYREGTVDPSSIVDESYETMRYLGYALGNNIVSGHASNLVFTITAPGTAFSEEAYPQTSGVEEYVVLVANGASSGLVDGQVISLANAVADVSGAGVLTLYLPTSSISGYSSGPINASAYYRTTVDAAAPRAKTYYAGNTNLSSVTVNSSGLLVSNTDNYKGHIAINNITTASPRTLSLGIADVLRVQKIYATTNANAFATSTVTTVDVTDNYTFDNGQRTWCYDHASISLKPGAEHYTTNTTTAQLLVVVDRLYHGSVSSGDLNYFNPNSYSEFSYATIPTFADAKTGDSYRLANFVDFRPVRSANLTAANNATNPYTNASAYTFETTVLPYPAATYQADYEFYLSRIDKVVLTKDRQFRIITGVPAVNPEMPSDDSEGITLYVLAYPAYTAFPELVNVRQLEYRRYTMKDIRTLEKRIENLEYYAALSTMDLQTLNNPELDEYDNERFKNGILTDNFSNDGTADFLNPETKVSIDHTRNELRPLALSTSYDLDPDASNTTNVQNFGRGGRMLSLPYTSVPFITQGLASKSVNINPFNVFSWNGTMTLFPSSDTWIDEITKPDLVTNLFNENDGIRDGVATIGIHYNHWSTVVVGEPTTSESAAPDRFGHFLPDPNNPHPQDDWGPAAGWNISEDGRRLQRQRGTIRTTRTQTDTTQFTQAIETKRRVSTLTTDLGERMVDSSIAAKMRGVDVDIAAKNLLPGATLQASFDSIDVTAYIERANRITIDVADADTFTVGDTITTANATATTGRGRVVGIVTDDDNDVGYLYVVDAQGIFDGATIKTRENAKSLVASETITVGVDAYQHWHGKITAITSTTNTVNGPWTLTLDVGAPTSDDPYTGKVIHFTDGGALRRVNLVTGTDTTETSAVAGYKAIITAYAPASRQITLSSIPADLLAAFVSQKTTYTSWNPIRYSIGNLEASSSGSISAPAVSPGAFFGMFRLPGLRLPTGSSVDTVLATAQRYTRVQSSALQFNVGSRVLRVQNAPTVTTQTAASTNFTAQGSTTVKQRQIVRTRQIETFTQAGNVQSSTTSNVTSSETYIPGEIDYLDPLSQTFIINQSAYPNGVFITHADLFFAKKGQTGLDVRVQIRTTVNGYPSADQVLGEAVVNAGNINIVPEGTTPSPGQITPTPHYTRFTFDAPVYLAPNAEYALTVLSNSNEYEIFVGELGQKLIGSDKIISQQPHGGSLFKSQNARTWVPEPLEDMMFVLHRAEFETRQGTLTFQLSNAYSTLVNNTEFDTAYVNVDYLDWTPSRQHTAFSITTRNAANVASLRTITPRENIDLSERMVVFDDTPGSFRLQATLRTANSHVAPVYDAERVNVVLVRNMIDNGQLYANGVRFTVGTPDPAQSANYSSGNTHVLTLSGGNGTGADLRANVNSSGYVTSIYVANAGYGYTETPTISMASSINFTTQPTFSYVGETSASSAITGERKSRYVTKKVNLSDGFDAGDLKLYISAVRGPQHNIEAYYKVLATGDPERFEDKAWTRMQLRAGLETTYSASPTERKEYEYRTAGNTASYTSNGVTYDRYHTFAIKLVLRSGQTTNSYASETTIVPRIANLRVMALDE